MTSKTKPQLLFAYALFMAMVVVSWTSCCELGRMSGDIDSVPRISDEILRICYDGWTENAATEVCECLAPNVIIGQYECREVEADDWYSSMGGCLVDQGMLLQIEVPIHPDSVTSYLREQFFVEVPDTNSRIRSMHMGSIRFLPRGERFDSIQFYLPSSVPLPYYIWPTVNSNGYNTGFHGVILNDSTIVGQFVFGPMYDSWGLDRDLIFSECQATIRKGRVE